jgi:DNA polymerase-1
MKTLLLIDANSLIHRCFHALPPLTTPDGRPSQALYGVASILIKLWREEKPDYAAALFDRPEPTFRKEEYPAYKAQRPPAPQTLISQIIEAHELFLRFGIETFEQPGFEADDLIATLTKKFSSHPDLRIMILTGDLDTLQLVEGDTVVVRTLKRGVTDTITYNYDAVLGRYGLEPKQLIDYKALVGDPSDNVKGVPGIGPKTASRLLKQFGSLKRLYEKPDEDKKLKEKLKSFQKQAEQSQKLIALRSDIELKTDQLADLKIQDDLSRLARYFKTLGFETLIKRIESNKLGPGANSSRGSSQTRMF